MKHYRRVTFEDRCHISAYLQAKVSISDISARLGFNKSTIYRELKRNMSNRGYIPKSATYHAAVRYERCRRHLKIVPQVEKQITCLLSEDWSPEQISGRLKFENLYPVATPTIYRFIKRHRKELKVYLRRNGKTGAGRFLQRKYRSKNQLTIHARPTIADQRKRIGDWERDGMYTANKQQILVLTDRKSRYTKLVRMKSIRPVDVTKLTEQTLRTVGHVHTVTNDNGPEFRDSRSLPYPAYHCDPGRPDQRGTIENTIGLLRQYLSNKTDLDQMSKRDLLNIERTINLRPRKCLGFQTPYEVFNGIKVALAV